MGEQFTIHEAYLGLKPFILIEVEEINDDETIEFRIRAGSGIETKAEIREVLEIALESLPEDDE
ncbi:hypothetical protein [Actinomadura sp. WMMB 499]|uniref:hypothetical protein n=1 Tax=Actinomadura sp. WMMB 499 TaxID=1219491 RepID=UPI001245B952|nr:hypothetical protein [Actinomadura sp. WMMB 499]QFG25473.1 hypothetical protein F7P10_34350 [Actinomadura sp. WMMB 499]